MIYIQQFWQGEWEATIQQQYENDCANVLAQLKKEALFDAVEPERIGLYLATGNAGAMPAILFWKEALEMGVRFASPKNFPWTLANAPCAWFARNLPVKGPNYTFCGNATAAFAAMQQATDDLTDEHIDRAYIIAMEFGLETGSMGCFAAMLLTNKAAGQLPTWQLPTEDALTEQSASEWMMRVRRE